MAEPGIFGPPGAKCSSTPVPWLQGEREKKRGRKKRGGVGVSGRDEGEERGRKKEGRGLGGKNWSIADFL